jgi:glutathione synthase/RimK-type ligase-like ATP-grasp enzyme
MRIALVTCEHPTEHDEDVDFLAPALRRQGVTVETPAWSDGRVEWSGYDLVVLSSPWDYHERPEEFRAWLAATAAVTNLQNPLPILEWNVDKRYLRELSDGGVPTIPTIWSEPGGEGAALAEIDARGWERVVIKPVVDLGAMNLVRVDAEMADRLLARYDRPVLIQPYLPSIASAGEGSIVYLDGELTHSLRKRPATGDFRIQPLYGGTHEAVEASAAEIAVAERALAASPGDPLYARVDLVYGDGGAPLLIELELIEPALYLDVAPRSAAESLARAMLARAAR